MEIAQSAGKSFAYILGVYLGDGNVSMPKDENTGIRYSPAFRLNTIDEDFAQAVIAALKSMSNRPVSTGKHSVKLSDKPNHWVFAMNPELCNKLVIDTEGKRFIPPYVFDWDKELKLEFIAGLMDSEGFVTYNKQKMTSYYMGFKCCEVWVRDFVRVLESVGIMVGKIAVCPPYKDGYKTPIRFHIKMTTWVKAGARFKIKRKQDRVDTWNARRLSSTTNMLEAA